MKKLFVLLLVIAVGGVLAFWLLPPSDDDMVYLTEPVVRGDIVKQVTATGEVSAVQLVSVGAQVSGQIKAAGIFIVLLIHTLNNTVKYGPLIKIVLIQSALGHT